MIFKKKKKSRSNIIRAMVMAAGYGTRLEPLTMAVPKPMMPIANKPCMQHNLELIRKHNIKEVVCNIHYHPEQIENYFFDGEELGISLSYSYEENLMGTAGGVRRMGREILNIDNTFVVMSSDALTDINLRKMVDYHKSKGAIATIALAPVEEVTQFGVVVLNDDHSVKAFQEKPKQEEALSNLVNAGIYVFEPEVLDMIPEGEFYDFGKQLFPMLIEKKKGLFGYKMIDFWSDVGTLDAYIKANMDLMHGRVRVGIPGKKISKNIWCGKNTKVAKTAHFDGSVILGDRCVVEDGVRLKNVVVGDRTVISKNSKIEKSVIWSDSIILSEVEIKKSIVGSWCYLGKGATVSSSVVANRCHIGASVSVPPGTKMNPQTELL